MMRAVKSTDLVRELKAAGWSLDRVRGSHHAFRHPERPGHVTVPHPKKDAGKGFVAAIREQAGL
jgi:predicted RNA binding protein YcfA (HicA-like mRNA interferase family)